MKDLGIFISNVWKKHKVVILGYAIWICLFSWIIPEMYGWSKREYWRLWSIWVIMIPIIAYCVVSLAKYFKNKNKK